MPISSFCNAIQLTTQLKIFLYSLVHNIQIVQGMQIRLCVLSTGGHGFCVKLCNVHGYIVVFTEALVSLQFWLSFYEENSK
jgi:hypothetical protein